MEKVLLKYRPVFAAKKDDGGSETLADKIAREKAAKDGGDASQEQAKNEQAATETASEKGDPEFENALNEPDVSTDDDVAAALKQDDEEEVFRQAVSGDEARGRSINAAKKLRLIALDFQQSSPDSHTIFGRAEHRFTLGDLRDLVGLPRAG